MIGRSRKRARVNWRGLSFLPVIKLITVVRYQLIKETLNLIGRIAYILYSSGCSKITDYFADGVTGSL